MFALHKAIEEGVNHLWTMFVFPQHSYMVLMRDEDATLEMKVKIVRYFRDLKLVHNKLVGHPVQYQRERNREKPAF